MNSKIWLSPPHLSGFENEFIQKAFENNYVAPVGSNITNFEYDLETYLAKDAFATVLSSGTAAIHLALIMLGVKTGDQVICQTKTFVASVNPVSYLGATPVFIDSERDTWNMCPDLLEKAIKERIKKDKKPKAIIIINLYGMPYKVDEIHAIAKSYNIPVVEDSAEALGSMYKNQKCGTFGNYSILSFNGNKIITTSAGGALISRTVEDKEQATYLATQAKDSSSEYNHTSIGYNYRMSNITAGIGRGQLKVIDNYVKLRRRNYDYYYNALNDINDISFLSEPNGFYSNRWLTCILLSNNTMRDELRLKLEENNIESRSSWKPMHLQPIYKHCDSYLNGVSNELYECGLCLPSGSSLTENDLERIVNIIKSYFEK